MPEPHCKPILEQGVVSVLLNVPEADDTRLELDVFTDAKCRVLFEAYRAVRDDGRQGFMTVRIAEYLYERGQLDLVGGAPGVFSVIETPGEVEGFAIAVDELIEAWHRRKALQELDELRPSLNQPDLDSLGIDRAINQVLSRLTHSARSQALPVHEMLQNNLDQAKPLIEGVIRFGEVACLVGQTKARKSWAALSLAIAAATGQEWLGTFRVEECNVLLVDGELTESEIAYRIGEVAGAMSVNPWDLRDQIQILSCRRNNRDIIEALQVGKSLRPKPDLIIVDPLFKFLPEGCDENDNTAMGHLIARVMSVADKMNAGVVIVHHGSKGSQADKRITDIGSGAGALTRAVDSHVVLREHAEDDCATLEVIQRSFAQFDRIALQWEFPLWHPAPEIDPNNLKRANSPSAATKASDDAQGVERVVEAIRNGHTTQRAIRDAIGCGHPKVSRYLKKATEQGRIEVQQTLKTRGHLVDHYGLV